MSALLPKQWCLQALAKGATSVCSGGWKLIAAPLGAPRGGRSGPDQSRLGCPFQLGRPAVLARSAAERRGDGLRDGLRGGLGGSSLTFSSAGV
jgi:hypothetical protein